jgi:hypothetical protein
MTLYQSVRHATITGDQDIRQPVAMIIHNATKMLANGGFNQRRLRWAPYKCLCQQGAPTNERRETRDAEE